MQSFGIMVPKMKVVDLAAFLKKLWNLRCNLCENYGGLGRWGSGAGH